MITSRLIFFKCLYTLNLVILNAMVLDHRGALATRKNPIQAFEDAKEIRKLGWKVEMKLVIQNSGQGSRIFSSSVSWYVGVIVQRNDQDAG